MKAVCLITQKMWETSQRPKMKELRTNQTIKQTLRTNQRSRTKAGKMARTTKQISRTNPK